MKALRRTAAAGRVIDAAEALIQRAVAGERLDPRLYGWALWIMAFNRRQAAAPVPW